GAVGAGGCGDAVAVLGGGDPQQLLVGAAPVGVGEVVAGAVEAAEQAGVQQAAQLQRLDGEPGRGQGGAGLSLRVGPQAGPGRQHGNTYLREGRAGADSVAAEPARRGGETGRGGFRGIETGNGWAMGSLRARQKLTVVRPV